MTSRKMKKSVQAISRTWFLALITCQFCYITIAQTVPSQPAPPLGKERIFLSSISSNFNTGQDYSPWLEDNLSHLVQSVWQNNLMWVDLTLKLKHRSLISELKFYDYAGTYNDAPDSIYAVYGTTKLFLGTFSGPGYMIFDSLKFTTPVLAEAILIHKYANNIPQKIYIYGSSLQDRAVLSNVILSNGILSPAFNSSTYEYKATVENNVKAFTITPILSNDSGSVKVNNKLIISGVLSDRIPLSVGLNSINVELPGKSTTNYTIIVNRNGISSPVKEKFVKIPIDSTRWYILNNHSNGLGALTDGILTGLVNPGYGMLINNYEAYYPIKPGEVVDLYQIKFYSYEGSLGNQPLTLSIIDSTGNRTVAGTFVGGVYQAWLGPYPGKNTYDLNKPLKNVKYIVLNSYNRYPAEMEFYGYYKPPNLTNRLVKKTFPLRQYFGINGFEWNFEDPNYPIAISNTLLGAMKSFTQVRHYMDWNKLESNKGAYTFNPVHDGGWNYDALYQACKTNNLLVLADLKTLPQWMLASYPVEQQDPENVPVTYGSNFLDPKSYLLQAKVAFQYAARFGSNSKIRSSLLSVDTSIRWANDPVNHVKEGTGLIHYIECDNERDKWWKGRKAYQTPYEYAANLSAFYDGNKNTMGSGIGVKNADSSMQVVMGGLASADPSYVHGMIEWCKQNRGYKADGKINLCWDIINYHLYANKLGSGIAPELSGEVEIANSFIEMAHEYAGDMPVWVTEAGYDSNQGSSQKTPAIGGKPVSLVEADWILRTALLYARSGVQRLFFYEAYDDNAANPSQYASSGLINNDKTRKPAADYLFQVNKLLGAFTYKKTISDKPLVDIYQLDNELVYVLYSPTQIGASLNYNLDLGSADSASIYKPLAGSNMMNIEKVKLNDGKLNLNVTETPLFIIPSGNASNTFALDINREFINNDTAISENVQLYPNPSINQITVSVNNKIIGGVVIMFITPMGKMFKKYEFVKNSNDFATDIDTSEIPMGVYFVQIKQGNRYYMRKIFKTY